MALHSSFKVTQSNRFDRHFGGTNKGAADPYISGYHFIYFKHLPPQLIEVMKNDSADLGIGKIQDVRNLLSSSCLSVTPPGGTLNKAEFTGLGGSKWSVPTNMDYGNTLTMKFLEYSRTPMLHIFHNWFRMIREYRTGVSTLNGSGAAGGGKTAYNKRSYSGTVLYWTTKPDGLTVEYSACYTGVFPTKDPQDLYTGDLTAVDKLEMDMEFSIDWIWKEKWVRDECQFWANTFKGVDGKNTHGASNGAFVPNQVGQHEEKDGATADVPS